MEGAGDGTGTSTGTGLDQVSLQQEGEDSVGLHAVGCSAKNSSS